MAHVWDTSCLYSRIKNVSGKTLKLSFLPPHGVTLAAGQTVTVLGDVVGRMLSQGAVGRRKAAAFAKCVADGNIVIEKLPTPVLWDAGVSQPAVVTVNNNTLAAGNPCWETSLS